MPEAARMYAGSMNLPTEDPRRSPRSKVFLSATLERAGETLPVVLRDLSEHGALIELKSALDIDSEVLFRRDELRVRGFVAWVHDGLAGICFKRPLRPEAVLRHINHPKPRPVNETLYRRPALSRPGMSAEEWRRIEEILDEPLRRSRRK